MQFSDSRRAGFAQIGLALAMVFGWGCSPMQETDVAPRTFSVSVASGGLLSLIAIEPKAGDAAALVRRNYLREGFGLARQYGLQPLGNLVVTGVIAGDARPRAVAFYAWPSADAEAQFNRDPAWPPVKATRPDGWVALRIHDQVEPTGLTLEFSSDRFYTLATAWIDPQRPQDYDRYLKNIESGVAAAGGRFIYQMVDPAFSSLQSGLAAPARLTLVEWDGPAGLQAFLESEAYAQNAALVRSGTTAFEVIALGVPRARPGE